MLILILKHSTVVACHAGQYHTLPGPTVHWLQVLLGVLSRYGQFQFTFVYGAPRVGSIVLTIFSWYPPSKILWPCVAPVKSALDQSWRPGRIISQIFLSKLFLLYHQLPCTRSVMLQYYLTIDATMHTLSGQNCA